MKKTLPAAGFLAMLSVFPVRALDAEPAAPKEKPWPRERRAEPVEGFGKIRLGTLDAGLEFVALESATTLASKDAPLGGASYGSTELQAIKNGRVVAKQQLERDGEVHLLLCDLNQDGRLEVVVATIGAGSGSYLGLQCHAWDGKRFRKMALPAWPQVPGANGHEVAEVADRGHALTVTYGVEVPGDTNAAPTGGKVAFKLSLQPADAQGVRRLGWVEVKP